MQERVIMESDLTTFRLPKPLKKAIKHEAVDSDRSMHAIIIEQLSQRYPDLDLTANAGEPTAN